MTAPPLDREAFPVTRRWRYLNHAGVAPLPTPAVEAMAAYAEALRDEGGLGAEAREARVEEVRAASARLLGVDAADVAFVKNTTEGLSFVAGGLDWAPGDRVVVPSCEFPSNRYPWLALEDRGVEVVAVDPVGPEERLALEAFEAALAGGGVRVVAVSWVQYRRGWRLDLAALGRMCAEHGALLCVDAIQGLGVVPAEMAAWGVDVATADAHKWMLGPEGVGVLAVRASARERLRVLEPGWNSVVHRGDFDDHRLDLDPTARRYEGGSQNFAGLLAMGASVDLLLEAGVELVWEHVDGLCTRLVGGLAGLGRDVDVLSARTGKRGGEGGSGIVAFTLDGVAPEQVCEALSRAGVVARERGGAVRVSPHGYNDADDVDAVVDVVTDLAGRLRR